MEKSPEHAKKLPLFRDTPAPLGGRYIGAVLGTACIAAGLLLFAGSVGFLLAKLKDGPPFLSRLLTSMVFSTLGLLAATVGFNLIRGRSIITRTVAWLGGMAAIVAFGSSLPLATLPPIRALDPVDPFGGISFLLALAVIGALIHGHVSKRREAKGQ